jgi:restriction system protein
MAIWLIRAGSHGEYEQKFIQENRVYVTWDGLDANLIKLAERAELVAAMTQRNPDTKPKAILNWVSQVWPFAHGIKKGDLVILPLKSQHAIQIGEVTGDYHFEVGGPDPYFHWRPVKWIGEAVPRANFGRDLLFTFGAFMIICRVQRNNAEQRIAAMRANGWKPETISAATKATAPVTDEAAEDTNLEDLAHDQIAQLISARFKGNGLTRLVEASLKAQGLHHLPQPGGCRRWRGYSGGSRPARIRCAALVCGSQVRKQPD